jgi:hypothetical protein
VRTSEAKKLSGMHGSGDIGPAKRSQPSEVSTHIKQDPRNSS